MAKPELKASRDSPSAQYLQSGPDTPLTCRFLVGNTDKGVPELITGCRLHLMAHSIPLRNMLYESEIAEEGTKDNPVKIFDVKPDTFRNFLKFVHCYSIAALSFEEALDLVYVAEKYIVEELLSKLEEYIVPLVNVNNVFSLMKRPDCLQNKSLGNCTKKIIQQETKELFAKEEFLELSAEELVLIVSQDILSVSEIVLWKEMLRWAKFKAQSEEGSKLREPLCSLLKYIRFCTLSPSQFNIEVAPSGVLTADEVLSIIMICGNKLDHEKSNSICYELNARAVFEQKKLELNFVTTFLNYYTDSPKMYSYMFLTTGSKAVQLLQGKFSSVSNNFEFAPKNLQVTCKCKVSLSRITDYGQNTSSEPPVQFEYVKKVDYYSVFTVLFPETMKLLPYNKYKLEFNNASNQDCCIRYDTSKNSIEHDGLLISWLKNSDPMSHLGCLTYKTM